MNLEDLKPGIILVKKKDVPPYQAARYNKIIVIKMYYASGHDWIHFLTLDGSKEYVTWRFADNVWEIESV